tara:strand:- start:347 stop:517 length:171 start_codon:yes stop_codon:yes gene_type:complete
MKKTFVLAIVSIFLTTSAYAVDCSDYKTFSHKWNMCKLGNLDKLGDDSPNKPEKKR